MSPPCGHRTERVSLSVPTAAVASIIFTGETNGTGQDELLFQSATNKRVNDWSRDGRFIVFSNQDPKTKSDLWALPMTPWQHGRPNPHSSSHERV
jgi:hypothetical protein